MRQRRPGTVLVLLLVAVLATTHAAFAQRTSGGISGTITDSTGGVLPGVNVTATCTETNQARTAVTDTQGGFTFPELPVCLYRVTAELPGFKTVARDAPVVANGVAKVDFKLEVGAQSETITVEASSAVVEFSDKLNNRVDTKRIEAMPLSGRDFNSLLNVTPGVQHNPGGGFQAVNVSGARTSSNNFMIDGISNNDRYYGDTVLNSPGVVGVPATLVPTGRHRRLHRAADAVGRIRRQGRRGDQRRDEERRQHTARHRLLLPARRMDRLAQLLRQASGRRDDAGEERSSTAARSADRFRKTRRSSSATTKASAWPSPRPTWCMCPRTSRFRRRARGSRRPV